MSQFLSAKQLYVIGQNTLTLTLMLLSVEVHQYLDVLWIKLIISSYSLFSANKLSKLLFSAK